MKHNAPVIKLVTDRYSAHVQRFSYLDVSKEDADAQYDLNVELAALAETVFARAPLFTPSGNRMGLLPSTDLGNAYVALRRAFTSEERARYDAIQEALNALQDKYEP